MVSPRHGELGEGRPRQLQLFIVGRRRSLKGHHPDEKAIGRVDFVTGDVSYSVELFIPCKMEEACGHLEINAIEDKQIHLKNYTVKKY